MKKIEAIIRKTKFEEVRQLATHYAKKGDLLYPHLKVKYEISGPSDVMWTVDDEIRDEAIAAMEANKDKDDELRLVYVDMLTEWKMYDEALKVADVEATYFLDKQV